jgi:hypothetical protein
MKKDNEVPESIDFSELLIGFEGMWVVLSDDKKKIIASGRALKDISERIAEGTVMKVPRFDVAYAPTTALQ